jgi:hypothetical protein
MHIQAKASVLERVDVSILMMSIAFFIPLIFTSPQWIIGIIINLLLFLAADKFDTKKQIPIIVLPSIAALLHGTLFGVFSLFLMYLMPFIWLGNAILVRTMVYSKLSYLYRMVLASVLKVLVLFITSYILVSLDIIPKIFLTAMGLMQLVTALAGGLLASIILNKKHAE